MDWHPLILSFEVATIAAVIAGVSGVAIGALLALKRFPGRELLDVMFTAPMVLPPTVLGYYLLVFIGRRSVIGRTFESLTGSSIVFTKTGAVIAASIGALPLIVKASRAAIESVDPVLARAARTLGAGWARTLLTVQLPLALRGIVAGLMLGYARSLGDFGVTLMIAGDIPGETQTASLAIYDAIQGQRDSEAAGMISVLTAVALFVLLAVNKLTERRDGH